MPRAASRLSAVAVPSSKIKQGVPLFDSPERLQHSPGRGFGFDPLPLEKTPPEKMAVPPRARDDSIVFVDRSVVTFLKFSRHTTLKQRLL